VAVYDGAGARVSGSGPVRVSPLLATVARTGVEESGVEGGELVVGVSIQVEGEGAAGRYVVRVAESESSLLAKTYLTWLGMAGLGGLVLAVGYPGDLRAEDPPKYGADAMPHGWVDSPLVFVAIGEDGIVSIVCHRSEMGQGVRTGMPMIVADELEADWTRVRVVQAPGDEARYGNQDTDGSRSVRHFIQPMRLCGASARTMLEQAAAKRWGVPARRCTSAGRTPCCATRPARRRGMARCG